MIIEVFQSCPQGNHIGIPQEVTKNPPSLSRSPHPRIHVAGRGAPGTFLAVDAILTLLAYCPTRRYLGVDGDEAEIIGVNGFESDKSICRGTS